MSEPGAGPIEIPVEGISDDAIRLRLRTDADNPAIVAVTATIERTTRLGEKRRIDLQFIHNRQTRQVALEGMLVDGKPQDLLAGTLNLMLLQLQ